MAMLSRVEFGGSSKLRGPFSRALLSQLRATKWRTVQPGAQAFQQGSLGGLPVAVGATFTPYANALKCTAHCHYCSEDLRRLHQERPNSHVKHLIRDQDLYFAELAGCFRWLEAAGVRFGLSLSGLEATSDPEWLRRLLRLADEHSPLFAERVLYSNGTGLLAEPELAAGLDRVEMHRDHHVEETNQQLMRLERRVAVRTNSAFARAVQRVSPLTVGGAYAVCILSRGGINTLQQAREYAAWARDVGFAGVIFRELSRLSDAEFQLDGKDRTANWIGANRVSVDDLLKELASAEAEFSTASATRVAQPDSISVGYYYYNERFEGGAFWGEQDNSSFSVTLECSCYDTLREQTEAAVVNKLVFHSNGNLTRGWDRDSDVLAGAADWGVRAADSPSGGVRRDPVIIGGQTGVRMGLSRRSSAGRRLHTATPAAHGSGGAGSSTLDAAAALDVSWSSGGSWALFRPDPVDMRLAAAHRERDALGAIDVGCVGPPRWLLRELTRPFDRVCDPFAGLGTGLLACELEGRDAIGFDLRPDRVAIARERAPRARVEVADAQALPLESHSLDAILTNVPYFTELEGLEGTGDLYAAATLDEWVRLIDNCVREWRRCLRPGGVAAVQVQNVRTAGGESVPLSSHLAAVMSKHLVLHDERICVYERDATPREPRLPLGLTTNGAHEFVIVATAPPSGSADR